MRRTITLAIAALILVAAVVAFYTFYHKRSVEMEFKAKGFLGEALSSIECMSATYETRVNNSVVDEFKFHIDTSPGGVVNGTRTLKIHYTMTGGGVNENATIWVTPSLGIVRVEYGNGTVLVGGEAEGVGYRMLNEIILVLSNHLYTGSLENVSRDINLKLKPHLKNWVVNETFTRLTINGREYRALIFNATCPQNATALASEAEVNGAKKIVHITSINLSFIELRNEASLLVYYEASSREGVVVKEVVNELLTK